MHNCDVCHISMTLKWDECDLAVNTPVTLQNIRYILELGPHMKHMNFFFYIFYYFLCVAFNCCLIAFVFPVKSSWVLRKALIHKMYYYYYYVNVYYLNVYIFFF